MILMSRFRRFEDIRPWQSFKHVEGLSISILGIHGVMADPLALNAPDMP